MDVTIKQEVIRLLQQLPVYQTNSLGTQHVVRCPYCGDSSNQAHGHFSIKIDIETDDLMVCRCLRQDCGSGILTTSVLEDLGLSVPYEIQTGMKSFNKKAMRKNKFVNNTAENFIVPCYNADYLNPVKLNYINSRLGSNIDYNSAQDLKIILDLNKFLVSNNIKEIPNVNSKYIYLLNNNYVGFLSTNNNCIVLRRINDNEKFRRYVKIILNPRNLNANTFYSIPNNISLMYTHDINIHITEGIFDIISVYNLNKNNKEKNYYFASCGFGYITILKYLIYNVGINTGLNIHIYSDNDKSDKDHFKYLFGNSSVACWLKSITFHRNTYDHEKDYGVPQERIIDSTFKIK